MSYLFASFAGVFWIILGGLLIVQQLSFFVQMWQRKPNFDPSTVLRAARVAGLLMSGALLVFLALVLHWRLVHGRIDWDWSLILGHVDAADGELVEEEPSAVSRQPSAVDEGEAWLEECVDRCTAFCLENDD